MNDTTLQEVNLDDMDELRLCLTHHYVIRKDEKNFEAVKNLFVKSATEGLTAMEKYELFLLLNEDKRTLN